jgi:hypothetical protein
MATSLKKEKNAKYNDVAKGNLVRLPEDIRLTIITQRDEEVFSAYCPELDMITAQPTIEGAIEDLIDMIEGYSEVFAQDWQRCYRHSRFASHWPFVRAVLSCRNSAGVRNLLDVIEQ